jgi:hypothetical protein
LFVRFFVSCIFLDHDNTDQLLQKREKLLAELNEMSDVGDIDTHQHLSSFSKRSLSNNSPCPTKSTDTQDEEGEEGEISESD